MIYSCTSPFQPAQLWRRPRSYFRPGHGCKTGRARGAHVSLAHRANPTALTCLDDLSRSRRISAVELHPSGRLFLSAAEDNVCNVWAAPQPGGKVSAGLCCCRGALQLERGAGRVGTLVATRARLAHRLYVLRGQRVGLGVRGASSLPVFGRRLSVLDALNTAPDLFGGSGPSLVTHGRSRSHMPLPSTTHQPPPPATSHQCFL